MLRQLPLFLTLPMLFFASHPALSSQPLHVRIVPGSVMAGTFKVRIGADEVQVGSRELEVQIELSNQQTVTRYVSVLYDPATRLLWWNTDSTDATAARRCHRIE